MFLRLGYVYALFSSCIFTISTFVSNGKAHSGVGSADDASSPPSDSNESACIVYVAGQQIRVGLGTVQPPDADLHAVLHRAAQRKVGVPRVDEAGAQAAGVGAAADVVLRGEAEGLESLLNERVGGHGVHELRVVDVPVAALVHQVEQPLALRISDLWRILGDYGEGCREYSAFIDSDVDGDPPPSNDLHTGFRRFSGPLFAPFLTENRCVDSRVGPPPPPAMEVTRTILDVLPSNNPLDDPDFDPLAYMNARFTDEASLGELDSFAIELEASIQATNQELRETVRAQVEGGGQAEQNLTEARASILHLFEKVEEIRSMAEESENMVKEICTEISSLDNAKKNLTESMATLRRMRDLSRYLDSLRASSDSEPCDLAAAAEGIHAISTILSKHFSGHMDVPRIAELNEKFLREKKLSSQAALQHLKDTDFSREDVEATSVIDACAVIDACGDEVRVAAVTSLVQNNIERYKAAFPAHADEAKLAKMERRLAWFRRLLKAYETNLEDHIPAAWCVPQELAVEYCLVTRGAIDDQLQGSSDELNIEIVVRVLQKTKEFEKDLTQRMQKGKQARSGQEYKYEGFITSCFEDVMGLYVRHEDDRMKNVVQSLLAEGGENLLALSGGESGQPATLPAAFGVFMYIGQSLEKCTAFCNDAVLVKLYKTWTSNLVYVYVSLIMLAPS